MEIKLQRYEQFIDRVEELGFMTFSNVLSGFPSLSEETPQEIWHTGDPETDPWQWKDRAAEEKRLAFGCILGWHGHKGFISARMYPLFYAAFHPKEHLEERMASGQVSQTVWRLWQLFEIKTLLDTGDIRREMGIIHKKGGSRIDSAIKELQQYFYITVAGNRRKTDKYGQPYGWPANVYDRVENWVPAEWLSPGLDLNINASLRTIPGMNPGMNPGVNPCMGSSAKPGVSPEVAQERILDAGIALCKRSQNINRAELLRFFGLDRK